MHLLNTQYIYVNWQILMSMFSKKYKKDMKHSSSSEWVGCRDRME